jgi:transcriptional regulator with XRE-family HTH domain
MKISKSKLELVMAEMKFTVSDLANITGISVTGISKIKNGQQNPRPATVGRIAKALGVSVEALIEN